MRKRIGEWSHSRGWLVLCFVLSSCGYISAAELNSRLDVDGDGLPRTEDCDDRDPSVGRYRFYVDLDQDGYGDGNAPLVEACAVQVGLSASAGDCDDSRPLVHPGQSEVCNQLDDDCNGLADDHVEQLPSFFPDADGDGFGDPNYPVETCDRPSGYVANSRDCDDTDANTFGARTWYADSDRDGWGDARASIAACSPPPGSIARAGDCDDTNPLVNPDAAEVCGVLGVDEDCDGLIDDADDSVDVSDGRLFWPDADGDGLGDAAAPELRCAADPDAGWVANRDDCDDSDDTVLDENCPWVAVSAGRAASCAVRGDLRVVCWGEETVTLNVPPGAFTDVAVGRDHACGLGLDGTLSCWGNTGISTFKATDTLQSVDMDGPYTCSLTTDGDQQCWYEDTEFRIGVAGESFVDIEAGSNHSCGLLSNDRIECLGACDSGECNSPNYEWVDVAAGTNFTCGLTTEGEPICWGDYDNSSPTGVFDTIKAYGRVVCASAGVSAPTCWSNVGASGHYPVMDEALVAWDVGAAHGCGITASDASLVCWGNDTFGQATPP